MFGIYLESKKDKRGRQFLSPGALVVTNAIMQHKGGWDTVAKVASLGNQKIENGLRVGLPLIMTLASMVWTIPTVANAPGDLKDKMAWINRLSSAVNTVVHVGSMYTTYRKWQAQDKLLDIQGQFSCLNFKVDELHYLHDSLTEIIQNVYGNFKKGIRTIFNGTSAAAIGH